MAKTGPFIHLLIFKGGEIWTVRTMGKLGGNVGHFISRMTVSPLHTRRVQNTKSSELLLAVQITEPRLAFNDCNLMQPNERRAELSLWIFVAALRVCMHVLSKLRLHLCRKHLWEENSGNELRERFREEYKQAGDSDQ